MTNPTFSLGTLARDLPSDPPLAPTYCRFAAAKSAYRCVLRRESAQKQRVVSLLVELVPQAWRVDGFCGVPVVLRGMARSLPTHNSLPSTVVLATITALLLCHHVTACKPIPCGGTGGLARVVTVCSHFAWLCRYVLQRVRSGGDAVEPYASDRHG